MARDVDRLDAEEELLLSGVTAYVLTSRLVSLAARPFPQPNGTDTVRK